MLAVWSPDWRGVFGDTGARVPKARPSVAGTQSTALSDTGAPLTGWLASGAESQEENITEFTKS